MPINSKGSTYDHALRLKDSYAVTASAAGQVASADKVLDLGTGRVDARTILQVSAIKVNANDERYIAQMQFSNSPTFASGVLIGPAFVLGALEVAGGSADTPVGEYELPWTNEIQGTLYRYARIYTHTVGTDETITYTAHVVKQAA